MKEQFSFVFPNEIVTNQNQEPHEAKQKVVLIIV